jgi:hypothetical protein
MTDDQIQQLYVDQDVLDSQGGGRIQELYVDQDVLDSQGGGRIQEVYVDQDVLDSQGGGSAASISPYYGTVVVADGTAVDGAGPSPDLDGGGGGGGGSDEDYEYLEMDDEPKLGAGSGSANGGESTAWAEEQLASMVYGDVADVADSEGGAPRLLAATADGTSNPTYGRATFVSRTTPFARGQASAQSVYGGFEEPVGFGKSDLEEEEDGDEDEDFDI